MKFCSECGNTIDQRPDKEGRERYSCASCGFIHYRNPRVIVGCAVSSRERVLMCRRSHEPALGEWMIPSGYLECGETLEEGAARETFEETGILIDPLDLELCSILNITEIEQVAILFRIGFTNEPAVRPGPECFETAFMSEQEIASEQLAWRRCMGNGPQQYFKELRSGQFTIRLMNLSSNARLGIKSREYLIASIT
jgi:ADP-ribose pyrophosphatase YjhB (NUDIX family)